jgi:hypothetical protein
VHPLRDEHEGVQVLIRLQLQELPARIPGAILANIDRDGSIALPIERRGYLQRRDHGYFVFRRDAAKKETDVKHE